MLAESLPQVRNLQFATGERVPRHWLGGRKSVTAFFNNLSVFFPPGERFFISSIKAYREQITEPMLAAQARAFYAQEGIHSREHVRYNAMLREQGFPVAAMEARVESLLKVVTKLTPQRMRLGVTCALEHFTALMAELLLRDPRLLEGADPAMKALWKWHAAEENEHKCVAFDVFQAVGGTYRERCVTMVGATIIFWSKVAEHQVRMMAADNILWSPSEWLLLLKYLFVSPGGLQRLFPLYFAYFRPGFHPSQHDSTELLEAWKRELQQSPDYEQVA
jgi:uncharacterized protein